MTVPVVTIFGGSGFIGRYVAQRMARAGWRVRVAVRRPDEAYFVRPYGVVGQVEPVQANIRDEASTRRAIAGADAVVNCVGVLAEAGAQTFEALMHEGAGRIARIAAEEGVARLVHVSAIGADPDSDSHYAAAKGRGEAAVRAAFPRAVILRPSIVFGTEDQFFNRFARMAQLSPAAAAGRRRDPVPAGLRRRRRRRRGRRGASGLRSRSLRARRPRGRHLPRADAADARDHSSPPADRRDAAAAGAAGRPGLGLRRRG